jgi:hypothetical protein
LNNKFYGVVCCRHTVSPLQEYSTLKPNFCRNGGIQEAGLKAVGGDTYKQNARWITNLIASSLQIWSGMKLDQAVAAAPF